MFQNPYKLFPWIAVLLLASSMIILILITSFEDCMLWGACDPDWTLEEIEDVLGIAIPQDATNIEWEGPNTPRFVFFHLRFNASPPTIRQFTSHFCQGELLPGFNPFNMVVVDHPFSYAHVIKMSLSSYIAYSPNTPSTTYGIRCPYDRLSVDQSDSNLYKIHLLHEFHGEDQHDSPRPLNKVFPINDFPLQVVGMTEANGDFVMLYDEFCLNIPELVVGSEQYAEEKWNNWLGTQVTLYLNDKSLPSAYLTETGDLIPSNPDEPPLIRSAGDLFAYCLEPPLTEGINILEIHVGEHRETYRWEFTSRYQQAK